MRDWMEQLRRLKDMLAGKQPTSEVSDAPEPAPDGVDFKALVAALDAASSDEEFDELLRAAAEKLGVPEGVVVGWLLGKPVIVLQMIPLSLLPTEPGSKPTGRGRERGRYLGRRVETTQRAPRPTVIDEEGRVVTSRVTGDPAEELRMALRAALAHLYNQGVDCGGAWRRLPSTDVAALLRQPGTGRHHAATLARHLTTLGCVLVHKHCAHVCAPDTPINVTAL